MQQRLANNLELSDILLLFVCVKDALSSSIINAMQNFNKKFQLILSNVSQTLHEHNHTVERKPYLQKEKRRHVGYGVAVNKNVRER